jgi:Fe-S cluster assembly protein SufD
VEALLCRRVSDYPSGFAALNTAFMADGAYIRLAAGTAPDKPILLLFVATEPELVTHTRNLVMADEGSRVCIVEHHVGVEGLGDFTNCATDVVAARDAQLEHHKVQQESLKAFHIAGVNMDQGHGSRFTSSAFALGGGLARADIQVGLNAERAECSLDGLYMTGGRQHIDHHTRIDHARPDGKSREFYKGVLDDAAGKVGIRMTLTAPGCPVAQTFPGVVESAVMEIGGVDEVEVELVWDPPWSQERMSEAARLELGLL